MAMNATGTLQITDDNGVIRNIRVYTDITDEIEIEPEVSLFSIPELGWYNSEGFNKKYTSYSSCDSSLCIDMQETTEPVDFTISAYILGDDYKFKDFIAPEKVTITSDTSYIKALNSLYLTERDYNIYKLVISTSNETIYFYILDAFYGMKIIFDTPCRITNVRESSVGAVFDKTLDADEYLIGKIHQQIEPIKFSYDTQDTDVIHTFMTHKENLIAGGGMSTGILPRNDVTGFISWANNDRTPSYGHEPLNKQLLNGTAPDGSAWGSLIYDFDISLTGTEFVKTYYGTIIILNPFEEGDITEGGWEKSEADEWMSLPTSTIKDKLYKYKDYTSNIYDGFTDLYSIALSSLTSDKTYFYRKYYRIYYDEAMESSGVLYTFNKRVFFDGRFPILRTYTKKLDTGATGSGKGYELDTMRRLRWGQDLSYIDKINWLLGSTMLNPQNYSAPVVYRTFIGGVETTGYIIQFDTYSCINTIEPMYEFDRWDTVPEARPFGDKQAININYSISKWAADDRDAIENVSNSDKEYLYPNDYCIIKGSTIMRPMFELADCVNTLCVSGWVNKDNPSIYYSGGSLFTVGSPIVIKLSMRTNLDPLNDVDGYMVDAQLNIDEASPEGYMQTTIIDVSEDGQWAKIKFWVKVEPWIYNDYWKPAPTAIFDNNEQTQWAKSF